MLERAKNGSRYLGPFLTSVKESSLFSEINAWRASSSSNDLEATRCHLGSLGTPIKLPSITGRCDQGDERLSQLSLKEKRYQY